MIYSQHDEEIRLIEYGDGLMATLTIWQSFDDGYDEALLAYQAQEALPYLTFPAPEGPFVAPWTYTPETMPPGTTIRVGIESGEVFTQSADEEVTLFDPGTYAMRLVPPAPHRGFHVMIEVTA